MNGPDYYPIARFCDFVRSTSTFIDALVFEPFGDNMLLRPIWRHAGDLGSVVTSNGRVANDKEYVV